MPAIFPDSFQVLIRDGDDSARLVAVVELVSPSNKDRPDTRLVFAGKSAAYLQFGVGLIIIDIVTSRRFNLHNEMVQHLGLRTSYLIPDDVFLYAVAYRPIRRGQNDEIDTWPAILSVGSNLPVLPLALRHAYPVPLDLNAAYEDACRRSRY